ncbi:MAG: hypothetical protein GVY31_12975 [Alphaproteobacteria bacterium]|jgi:energy-converting hydrogenase Eha subunit A|nr:hypothetical protein [Alphaproteobacteria bacterium]
MTDASFTEVPYVAREKPARLPLPPPVLFDTPLLIGDCATPFQGSTILHAMLREDAEDQ